MHVAAHLALAFVLGASPSTPTVGIDAVVTEVQPNCFVCAVMVVGKPAGVVISARELNLEKGGTSSLKWVDEPRFMSWIEYDGSCSVANDGSKATVNVRIRARDWPREYSGNHTAIVRLQR